MQITLLHLWVRYLSRLGDGVLPEDDKYLFRQRASRLLSRWDEIMLVDLKVRKLKWALKGRRSLVYLRKSDGELFRLMALGLIFGLHVDEAGCTRIARPSANQGCCIRWLGG